jgi:GMP synthase-like glutamine amidotransferase
MATIGLLRMCELSPPAIAAHGDYLTVFQDFFGDHTSGLVDIPVHEGATPGSVDDCDVWVISGSQASVFDDLDWIRTAEDITRDLIADERPTFGICFGHQLMARALGGRVERAGVGWGVGVHRYDVVDAPHWLPGAPASIGVLALHQDQVVEPPPDSTVWARSDFCPVAGLTYGDRAWSIQPHPEFSTRLVGALCQDRRDRLGDDVTDAALASLDEPIDGQLFANVAVGG